MLATPYRQLVPIDAFKKLSHLVCLRFSAVTLKIHDSLNAFVRINPMGALLALESEPERFGQLAEFCEPKI